MNKSPDERFLIESKKQNTNLEKYGVEYPSTLPNNRKKSKIKMVKFWESLNDDERTDLILSFQHAWTEERRNDKSLDMKVLWASLTDEENGHLDCIFSSDRNSLPPNVVCLILLSHLYIFPSGPAI